MTIQPRRPLQRPLVAPEFRTPPVPAVSTRVNVPNPSEVAGNGDSDVLARLGLTRRHENDAAENAGLSERFAEAGLPVGERTPEGQLRAFAARYGVRVDGDILSQDNQNRIIQAMVRDLAQEYNVPAAVALSVVSKESHGGMMWNADGTVLEGQQDPGDKGAMQINERWHPDTRFQEGRDYSDHDLATNLEANLRYGLAYLEFLHGPGNMDNAYPNGGFGSWDQALAAYNHPGEAERNGNRDYVYGVRDEGRRRGFID